MGWFNHQPGKCWEFCGSFGFAVLWLKDGLGLLLCQPEVASACRTTPKKHGKCPSETAHVSSAWCSRLHPRDSCWRCRWKKSNAVRLNSSGGPGQCPACRSDWLPLLPAQAQGHYQSPWAHDWDAQLTPKKVICFALFPRGFHAIFQRSITQDIWKRIKSTTKLDDDIYLTNSFWTIPVATKSTWTAFVLHIPGNFPLVYPTEIALFCSFLDSQTKFSWETLGFWRFFKIMTWKWKVQRERVE